MHAWSSVLDFAHKDRIEGERTFFYLSICSLDILRLSLPSKQVLATLGLPVTARDVAGLMRRFSTGSNDGDSISRPLFLYPRLLQSIVATGGRDGRLNAGIYEVQTKRTYWS